MQQQPVVVLDNGAGTCKLGFGGEPKPRKVFPNCIAKPKGERQAYIGDMLLDSKEVSQLTLKRPFDRGYLVNWELEREIWSHALRAVLGLGKPGASLSTHECGLCMTVPMFNFAQVQAATEQVVFEELRFASFFSAPAPLFSLRRMAALHPTLPAAQAGAGVVVDAGFSFMHAVPFFDWQPIMQGVKRVDIGGKAMTNYLKELVSYRSLNMMDEPYLMEHVKELVCFVSQDTRLDLKLSSMRQSVLRREFVLPDGVHNMRGYLKPLPEPGPGGGGASAQAPQQPPDAPGGGDQAGGEGAGGDQGGKAEPSRPRPDKAGGAGGRATGPQDQVLVLNNERFMVPELVFYPGDVGLQQAGIAEAVHQAIAATPQALQGLLYNNVMLTGGLVACPGFSERFAKEMQPWVPDDVALGVHTPPEPATCAWEGMSAFVAGKQYHGVATTRQQYEETGGAARNDPRSAW